MVITGYKYQRYNGDELEIWRSVNTTTSMINEKGDTTFISTEELKDKYVMLTPDAFLNIMITDRVDNPDVYLCVNKATNISSGSKVPDLIMRQSILNLSRNTMQLGNKIFAGDCITANILPGENRMTDFMEFKEINATWSIALYVDDTLDTILEAIGNVAHKAINAELASIKAQYGTSEIVEGYVDNLRELMLDNYFIARYREIFNIMQVDWKIEDPNNPVLSPEAKKDLEDALRKYIDIKVILKYGKDIDVAKIVSIQHIMVSDSTETIYLIAYEVTGFYPIDDDIARAMHVM